MKRCTRILSIFLSFVLIFSMYFTSNVKAEVKNLNVYNYEWKEDVLVSGSNEIERSFYVPQNMNCYNFTVSLKIKQSPTLIKELSSVSVLINDTKVYSIMMSKIQANGQLNITVPEKLINKGMNSIAVKGFLKSTKEKCEINNDINWFVVEKTSAFKFNYKREDSRDISDIFDNTYYSDGSKAQVNIALPQDLIEDNYSQISSLAALTGFVHKNKETKININTLKFSELNSIDRETIVIGTVNQLKAFNNTLLKEEQWKRAEENGYIAIRKIGNKNHFIIIVSKEEQIEMFSKIFGNKSSLGQIKGKDYVLDKDKIVNEKEFNANPSLKTLGYEDSSQSGNGTKEFNYYFTIPAKKILTENSMITFGYNYSELTEDDQGYLTVEVNGENLMSKELAKDKVTDKVEFIIPERYYDYTGFNISLKFNLKPSVERCTAQSYENIWVSVDSLNSNFKLELKDREKYSLLNSQGILQSPNGNVEGSILVDNYENLSIASICKMSSYLGEISQGVNKLSIKEAMDKENPTGAIFSLTKSPIIKSINDNLRIPISNNGEFVNKDLFIQNTATLGAIEITLNGKNLVITASDKEQLNKAIQKYPEVASSKDTIILDQEKIIASFEEEKDEQNKSLEAIKIKYDIILALVGVLGASITIFIIYNKKVK